jgi:hypothetical protein
MIVSLIFVLLVTRVAKIGTMLVGLKNLGGSSQVIGKVLDFQTKGSKFNMNFFDILNRF